MANAPFLSAGNGTATKTNPGDRATHRIQLNSIGSNETARVALPEPPAAHTIDLAGILNAIPVAIHDP